MSERHEISPIEERPDCPEKLALALLSLERSAIEEAEKRPIENQKGRNPAPEEPAAGSDASVWLGNGAPVGTSAHRKRREEHLCGAGNGRIGFQVGGDVLGYRRLSKQR